MITQCGHRFRTDCLNKLEKKLKVSCMQKQNINKVGLRVARQPQNEKKVAPGLILGLLIMGAIHERYFLQNYFFDWNDNYLH